LTALCDFMAASVEETAPRALIGRALGLLQRQTGATVAGFLSLDEDDPLPKVVVPQPAQVDMHLSKQLTLKAQRDGRPQWLAGRPRGGGAGGRAAGARTGWLPFGAALCGRVGGGGGSRGAAHVYKGGRLFSEREVRFCEVRAGSLANSLPVPRSRRTLEAENS